jgi:glycosyltransferase involved in cell wall biosynthesis
MKKVLLVQPNLQPPGGGNGVAAWILEALKAHYDVTALTLVPVNLPSVNRFYGTSLAPGDFTAARAYPALSAICRRLPLPLDLLRSNLLFRACKRRQHGFDVLITANNEADFGRRGIQYIHFPSAYQPRPAVDLRWYHLPALVQLYRATCRALGQFDFERMKQNVTLTNSDWTGQKVRQRHGIESRTLYPPVAGEFADVPWEERENGLLCIGRISPEKRIEEVIDILSRVRSRGHDVHLHVVGTADDGKYYRRIRALARQNAAWLFLEENLSRQELAALIARHRYGIHGMLEEHFGTAVAEMVRAGCIAFVPRGGGQVEIVGDELTYDGEEDAAEKIAATLADEGRQAVLRQRLAVRRGLFSGDRFVEQMRALVAAMVEGDPSRA